ncbi:MAG: hypothetical protein A2033_02705 [Bacteroidetes bacterium GWA2_31_9]|nr:MAG: hypothetical protein A2033_02705 [Bacteroidetes bacterium GWA2_31_9]
MKLLPVRQYEFIVDFSESETIIRISKLCKFYVDGNIFYSSQSLLGFNFAFIEGIIKSNNSQTTVSIKISMQSVLIAFLIIILGFCLLFFIVSIVQSFLKNQIIWDGIFGSIGFSIFAYIFYYSMYVSDASSKLEILKKALRIS